MLVKIKHITMKHIGKFNENISEIKIGDIVEIPSFEGSPRGKVYDIIKLNTRILEDPWSYWVDLGRFGKMEFSKDELVKV